MSRCNFCEGRIWPWQHEGWYVGVEHTWHWHTLCWERWPTKRPRRVVRMWRRLKARVWYQIMATPEESARYSAVDDELHAKGQ